MPASETTLIQQTQRAKAASQGILSATMGVKANRRSYKDNIFTVLGAKVFATKAASNLEFQVSRWI